MKSTPLLLRDVDFSDFCEVHHEISARLNYRADERLMPFHEDGLPVGIGSGWELSAAIATMFCHEHRDTDWGEKMWDEEIDNLLSNVGTYDLVKVDSETGLSPFEVNAIWSLLKEQIDDAWTTAYESASWYWAAHRDHEVFLLNGDFAERESSVPMSEHCLAVIDAGGYVILRDCETDEKWIVTKAKLVAGLVNGKLDAEWLEAILDGSFDAEAADCWLQISLLGEIVYG